MKRYFIFIIFLMSFLMMGCTANPDGSQNDNNQDVILPTNINITNKKDQIKVGESFTIGVEVLPNNTTDKSYEISVFPEGIVEISNNTITGLKSGSVLITIRSKSENSLIYQFALNVIDNSSQTGFSIEGISSFIKIDEEINFNVYYNDVTFKDYDFMIIPEDVVEIQDNKILGIKEGTAKIIFYPKGSYNEKLEFEVNVYDQDFEVFGLSKIMEINESVDLKVILKGTNISAEYYNVTVSDPNIISYNEGKITTLKSGKCEVKISLIDNPNINKSYTISVVESINQVPTSIEVKGMPYSMVVGKEAKLDITFGPIETSSQEYIITTYPKDIIEVNGSTLKAIKEGEVVIYIESTVDSSVCWSSEMIVLGETREADIEIIVNNIPSRISLASSNNYFLNVEIPYPYTSEYVISLSDNSIIEILDNGLIKPLNTGIVTITITLPKYQHLYKTFTIEVIDFETCADNSNQDKCKDPETWDWAYNRSGFDGKGMTIKLLHSAPEEVDPNDANFCGERKADKALQLFDIQCEYNITLSIERFPDHAAWGLDRVAWINDLAAANDTKNGDIFAISSDWIPTLAKGQSIAVLENVAINNDTKEWEQVGGVFSNLKYTQSQEKIKQYQFSKKVYGYSVDSAHADFFLYYNQALIRKYSLEDPATLWNEGKWDWTTFYNFLQTAQNAFDSAKTESDPQMYAFGGWINEVVRGALSARGGKFIDPVLKKVMFNSATVIQMYWDLRDIKEAGMWAPSVNDVCHEFMAGNQLFQPAELWFLSSKMRFAPADETEEKMEISLVPYPTADGDAEAKANYTIPMKSDYGYAIRNIRDESSGLTVEVLANILDDFCRGLRPEFDTTDINEEDVYRIKLNKLIDSVESVEAVMSVENNIEKYGYTDYLDVVSKHVGAGSHWRWDGFYTWGLTLLDLSVDPATVLNEKLPIYQAALDEIIPN